MKKGIKKPCFIVADDFTGANDIGVALASSGIVTHVLLATENLSDGDSGVGVICTNSRDLESDEAKDKLTVLAQHYRLAQTQPLLIKKVDSTLRGHIGSEIEALLNSGYSLAIVAIAAPFAKRKTVDGLCYVNDKPLSETEFASDPKSPIHSSRIQDIVRSETSVEVVEYQQADRNESDHRHHFSRLYHAGAKVIVCDAESHDDLLALYLAAEQLSVPCVFVTTGELTYSLVENVACPSSQPPKSHAPILAIIGSMSEMTLSQSQYLIDHNEAKVIDLELAQLMSPDYKNYLEAKVEEAEKILSEGENCIFRSCKNSALRHELKDISSQYQLSQKQLAEHVRECLASLAYHIIQQANVKIGGLILCGGDIAIATAQQLGASSYQVGGIIAKCVPWGTLNSTLTPFPIFTKAGGFGEPTTFSQVITQLNQEVR